MEEKKSILLLECPVALFSLIYSENSGGVSSNSVTRREAFA